LNNTNTYLINIKNIYLIIYALFTKIQLYIIGQILLSELFSFYFIFKNINILKKISKNLVFKIILNSLIGLLCIQIISDIYNDSLFYNYIRGWSVIIFSIFSIFTLTILLFSNSNKIIIFLFGLAISNIIINNSDLNFATYYENTNFFKIKYVPFLNPLVLIFYYFLFKNNFKIFRYIILLIYSLVCFYYDARSNGLIFLITTLFIYIYEKKIKLTFLKTLIIMFLFYLLFLLYSFLITQNIINGSNSITQFSKMSNKYNPFELLYYGRSEIPVLFSSIMDKPILGHGSWGIDKTGRYSYELSFITKSPKIFFSNYIRAHSILFGYFAYAGVFAFVILFYLFLRLFQFSFTLITSNKVNENIKHIILFYCILMFWHMLFSPIGTLRYDFVYFSSIIISQHVNTSNNFEKEPFF